ncbi:hypothetical protein J2W21_000847 [Sinomonas atrocyanea]|uniref:hypothetical protein n=1 Tax=Sinomonas atrocyanea TaxID=37927 RepID=UPI00278AF641|nr:hypothetical protein [Sinomonas atrocyanea]MDP9883357.1 hypothetical protein [Sinomonas atrocyanea]
MTSASAHTTESVPRRSSEHNLTLPRIPWEDGPDYWKRFTKPAAAGWTSSTFFPIAVFMGKPSQAEALKSLGVNTYLGAEKDGSPITSITQKGLYVVAQSEWTKEDVGNDSSVVGWLASDECDMGIGCPGSNTDENLRQQKQMVQELRNRIDGRFVFANYGGGILGTYWAIGNMPSFMSIVDAASVDQYAYTSPHIRDQISQSPAWPKGLDPGKSASYGWLVDRMRSYQSSPGAHPNWIFVETGRPYLVENGSSMITTDQIEGAMWSAIIHEARGISFFQHNNGSGAGTYSLVDAPSDRLKKVSLAIKAIEQLAPAINTQSYAWSFHPKLDTMLKVKDGFAYVFAAPALGTPAGQYSLTLPPGISGRTVEVIGEARTTKVEAGQFSDTFASESAHHVYRIRL